MLKRTLALLMLFPSICLAAPFNGFTSPTSLPDNSVLGPVRANGTNYSPSLTALMTGRTMTAPSVVGGLAITGTGELSVLPAGSPIAGSRASVNEQITMNHAVQEYGHMVECKSKSVAPALGGNVCLYSGMELLPASGGGWSINPWIQIDSGFDTSKYTAIGVEADVNNLSNNYGAFAAANSVGLLMSGQGYENTAAFSIQTGNTPSFLAALSSSTGISKTTLPNWGLGYHCGDNAVDTTCFDDTGSSYWSYHPHGAYAYASDYADANTTGGAVRLGALGAVQGIVGRYGQVTRSMMYLSPDNMMHLGSIAYPQVTMDGSIYPVTDNAYTSGSATQRWTGVWTLAINGVPAPGKTTFANLPACTSANIGMHEYITDGRKSGEAAGSGTGAEAVCMLTAQGATTGTWEVLALQGAAAN